MIYRTHNWEAQYHWPETFRFKHLLQYQPFGLYGRIYCRISARRYVPCDVSFIGSVRVHAGPIRCIDSINTPVRIGCLDSYVNQ